MNKHAIRKQRLVRMDIAITEVMRDIAGKNIVAARDSMARFWAEFAFYDCRKEVFGPKGGILLIRRMP